MTTETISGNVQLHPSQFGSIPILRRIYEFESLRVSGPGSWKRDINDCLWTFDELAKELGLDLTQQREYRAVVDWLVGQRQAMRVPSPSPHSGSNVRYISRMAEIVRLLGHTPEYWHRGRPAVEAVRWLVEDKLVPKRSIGVNEFIESLKAIFDKDAKNQWRENLKDTAVVVIK